MMSGMLNDKVSLVKKDGTIYNDIKANVQPTKIFINDGELPIEEGDIIERELPNGLKEKYIVLDRGFFPKQMGFDAHYQCNVKKETTLKFEQKKQTIYNISGMNAKVNINSIDNSLNIINLSKDELFNNLIDVIKENIENNNEIINAVEDFKNSVGKKSIIEKYQNFIASVANHMTIILPFIPALTQLLQ